MSRNITIDNESYELLASLKRDPRDSFTKVIKRHVRKPADTCGELMDSLEGYVPPVEIATIDKFIKSRGRRSHRK